MAAVVIGRNEGARLEPSLTSARAAGLQIVYADSGSTDGSAQFAERLGFNVVSLDPTRPFSAARGRNEGLAEVLRLAPDTQFIMFLDGDCTLEPDFPSAAIAALDQLPDCAIVTGHLSERDPQASIYNRLWSIEWRSPVGPIRDGRGLGGIMAARVGALKMVGGFNAEAIAGEEADLAVRLEKAGWSITKLDVPMATHDAQMVRFGQWWRRTVRAGHAIGNRFFQRMDTKPGNRGRALRSAIFWGFLVPIVILLLLLPTRGLSLLLLTAYVLLGWRIYRYYRRMGIGRDDARLASCFIVYGKVPEFIGIILYGINRLRGRFKVIDWR
jgi:glycosyltransferase involved in cell wall biosynthesis